MRCRDGSTAGLLLIVLGYRARHLSSFLGLSDSLDIHMPAESVQYIGAITVVVVIRRRRFGVRV